MIDAGVEPCGYCDGGRVWATDPKTNRTTIPKTCSWCDGTGKVVAALAPDERRCVFSTGEDCLDGLDCKVCNGTGKVPR